MQSLLGAASYLRRYIPLYAKICAPLERLRFADAIVDPAVEAIQAFNRLKQILSNAPVLSRADFSLPFCIGTDASQFAVGAVLFQRTQENHVLYVSFEAQALSRPQVCYPAYKRELFAIVFALHKFRNWIYGTKFTIYTDHQSLANLFTSSKLNYVVNYWLLQIFEHNFDVVHVKGISNILPDALSRLCYYDDDDDAHGGAGNEGSASTTQGEDGCAPINTLHNSIDDACDEALTTQLVSFVKERFSKTVPPEELRSKLIKEVHSEGHSGTKQLFQRLFRRGYFWPTMRSDIVRALQSCETCLTYNVQRVGYHPLQQLSASLPFDVVHLDLFGPLPVSSQGNRYVLLAVDSLSRFVVLRPLKDKSALSTAQGLYSIFVDFGFPKTLISDNGAEFVNQVIKAMVSFFRVKHKTITAYNPRSNGAAERYVQEAKRVLSKILEGELVDWDSFLPTTQQFLNIRLVSRTKSSPFALMFGRAPNQLIDYSNVASSLISIESLIQRQRELLQIVYPAINEQVSTYQTRIAKYHNKRHKLVQFKVGDVVYRELDTPQSLSARYEGPFEVIEVTDKGYRLKDGIGDVSFAPANKLKLSTLRQNEQTSAPGASAARSTSSGYESQPSADDDGSKLFEVTRILAHKKVGNRYLYQVKWSATSRQLGNLLHVLPIAHL